MGYNFLEELLINKISVLFHVKIIFIISLNFNENNSFNLKKIPKYY